MSNYFKKTLQIIFLLFASTSSLIGQWQTDTLPSQVTGQKMYALDKDSALISCSSGVVYKTIDGGNNWVDISPKDIPSRSLIDMSFNGAIGALATNDSFLVISTNLGNSWEIIDTELINTAFTDKVNYLDSAQIIKCTSVNLFNDSTVFVGLQIKDKSSAYHHYILKSQNLGHNWERVYEDITNNDRSYITSIKFENETGYAVGSKGKVLKSINKGFVWEPKALNDSNIGTGFIYDFEILANDSLLILSSQSGVVLLHNELNSSKVLYDQRMNDIVSISDSTYIIGGNSSLAYLTRDAGANWLLSNNGIASTIFELAQFNDKLYALSNNGVFYTIDLNAFNTPQDQIEIIRDNNKVTVYNPTYNNENITWILEGDTTSIKVGYQVEFTIFKPGNYQLKYSIPTAMGTYTSEPKGFTVEEDQIVYQWETKTFPTSEIIAQMISFSDGHALIFGNKTTILRSEDSGESWQTVNTDDFSPQICNSAAICNDSTAIASFTGGNSEDSYILYTTDKGLTWHKSVIDIPKPTEADLPNFKYHAAKYVNDTLSLAIVKISISEPKSKSYYLIHSKDQGKTWTILSNYNFADDSFSSTINNINSDSKGTKITVSGVEHYWITHDLGINWLHVEATDMGSINDAIPFGNNYIFASYKGTFFVDNDSYRLMYSQSVFDAIFTPNDSLLLSGKNEATTYISDRKAENWIPYGSGITATYYDYAILGDWIYALRKGTESFRTPVWYTESYKNVINSIDAPTYSDISSIIAYPNPASANNIITISNCNFNASNVIISDLMGKIITTQFMSNNSFIAPTESGIYIVNIISNNKKKTIKLIVR